MRRLVLIIPTFFTWAALAQAKCSVHLIDDSIPASQTEFVRQMVQGALPNVRDVTLVRVADLEAGVRRMGFDDRRARAFIDVTGRTLRLPAVREADPDSAMGRAARRLAVAAVNPGALSVALLHQLGSPEILFMFAGRGVRLDIEDRRTSGQPTFTDMLLKRVPDAPMPHGILLIDPNQFTFPEASAHLDRDLLAAVTTYEVSLTLHDWALAHLGELKTKARAGMAGYLALDRAGNVVIDGGFARILMFGQLISVRTALAATEKERAELGASFVKNIVSSPRASALARRLKLVTADDLTDWSAQTMARIHDDLILANPTP